MGWFTDLFVSSETKEQRKEIEASIKRCDELEKEIQRLIKQSENVLKEESIKAIVNVSKGD